MSGMALAIMPAGSRFCRYYAGGEGLSDLKCPRSGRMPRFCTRCGGRLVLGPVPGDLRQRYSCQECGHVHYLDTKVAAATICRYGGGIVLVKRSIEPGRGKWVIPGGFLECDETVEQAAVRETVEETGLEVALERLVGVYSYPASVIVVIVYEARVAGGRLEAGDECLEASVFDLADIPWDDLAFVTSRDALRDWLDSNRQQ